MLYIWNNPPFCFFQNLTIPLKFSILLTLNIFQKCPIATDKGSVSREKKLLLVVDLTPRGRCSTHIRYVMVFKSVRDSNKSCSVRDCNKSCTCAVLIIHCVDCSEAEFCSTGQCCEFEMFYPGSRFKNFIIPADPDLNTFFLDPTWRVECKLNFFLLLMVSRA
jgi:hypothetical protein